MNGFDGVWVILWIVGLIAALPRSASAANLCARTVHRRNADEAEAAQKPFFLQQGANEVEIELTPVASQKSLYSFTSVGVNFAHQVKEANLRMIILGR